MNNSNLFPLVDPEPYTLADIFCEPVSRYTRAQALDDGVLIDVSERAREAGFVLPVAMTQAAWSECVAWSESDSRRKAHQDESGRLWDVLWVASLAAERGGSQIRFQVYRVPRPGKCTRPRVVALKASVGPGDDGEPVVTIMLPGED